MRREITRTARLPFVSFSIGSSITDDLDEDSTFEYPHWTGEDLWKVFVLDHKRWTVPMKEAIDNLLNKHHGKKDLLKLVDQEYAAMVHSSCTDQQHASSNHKTAHSMVCQALGQTAEYQYFITYKSRKTAGMTATLALIDRGE
ncbi:uncharacterized protein LOC110959543 [Tachysurus ichikawai]